MSHLRRPVPLFLTAMLFLGAVGILAASGSVLWPQESHPPAKRAPPPTSFPLYFDPSVSYDDALRAVTDLGLQPSLDCGYEDDLKAGRVITHMQWQPAGQRAVYVRLYRLFVALTPMTPSDWTTRLRRVPGWVANNTLARASQPLNCPSGSPGLGAAPRDSASASPPSLDTSGPAASILDYAQAASSPIARIAFAPSTTYDEALYAISDLGLRLADPCYERAQLANYPTSAPWPGAGQEQRFAETHDLIVAAAPLVVAARNSPVMSPFLHNVVNSIYHLVKRVIEMTTHKPTIGALLHAVWAAARARISAGLMEAGFTDLLPAHLMILQYPGPDGERPSTLARRAGMSKQAMNQLLCSLEQLGYIERVPDERDGRARIVRLTGRGVLAITTIRGIVAKLEREWAGALGAARFEEFKSILDTLRQIGPIVWE